ncbi:MAG TPA: hypothetical protein VKF82_03790 [Candidatus Eremiobacteraceae bacterium]|nr:hypothetical protein [Candidatus Eremiobacteraceae bacterium]
MSLEVLNTAGTLLTAAVIATTAIAAIIQLRHMRTGNQIAAMLSIGENFSRDEFKQAEQLVVHKLGPAMSDPAFRRYVVAFVRDPSPAEVEPHFVKVRQAAILIGNTYEELGILVKTGIVDAELFLDRYCAVINRSWNRLADFTALARESNDDPGIWENFEYVTVLSQDWMKKFASSYPKGMRRLEIRSQWPEAARERARA